MGAVAVATCLLLDLYGTLSWLFVNFSAHVEYFALYCISKRMFIVHVKLYCGDDDDDDDSGYYTIE